MSKDKEESRNIPPAQDLNRENAEKKRIDSGENVGVKSGDLSATSPVAKNEIKEHHDTNIGYPSGSGTAKPKDDKNVEEWSPLHSGSITAKPVEGPSGSATSLAGEKNGVKEHHDTNIGEHSAKAGAGPSGVNASPNSDDETEFVDIVGIDEDENKGLTAAEVLRAQLEAEEQRWNEQRAARQRQRQAQLDAEERRRSDQRQRQTSSSSSNDIESCDENSINPTLD